MGHPWPIPSWSWLTGLLQILLEMNLLRDNRYEENPPGCCSHRRYKHKIQPPQMRVKIHQRFLFHAVVLRVRWAP